MSMLMCRLYISADPLRSVRIFRVIKTYMFETHSRYCLNCLTSFFVFDLDYPCVFPNLMHDCLAFVAGL